MKPKRVRDLMLPLGEYATIGQDKTLVEALAALSKSQLGLTRDQYRHRAVLVLDAAGKVVGKLSHWAILRSLNPDFLKTNDLDSLTRAGLNEDFIDSLKASFSGISGSLETMCQDASQIKARDAMVSIGESIEEDALLTQAIRRMVEEHVQSLPVTRADEVVGILRLSDVFEEVARLIKQTGSSC